MERNELIAIMAAIIFNKTAGKDTAYQDDTLKYQNAYCINKAKALLKDIEDCDK